MIDNNKWKHKAMAFAIRSHRHLWGKNNEDPLAFLFRSGLTNEFSKTLYLGWNKFGQERPCNTWGLKEPGKFILPPGLVFPHIKDKDLKSIFIISMKDPSDIFTLPGSDPSPIVLGDPGSKPIKETGDMIQGLLAYQESPEATCVIIHPV